MLQLPVHRTVHSMLLNYSSITASLTAAMNRLDSHGHRLGDSVAKFPDHGRQGQVYVRTFALLVDSHG
jgi:hypothetical protein